MVKGLEFPNADAKTVLNFYEHLTGKQIVSDTSIAVPVNIVVRKEIPKAEAIRIIELALLMNGITLVPAGGNIVQALGLGKNPRGFGIPLYSDEMQLPENEQVVSFLLTLNYGDPTKVAATLTQFIPPSQGAYTQILALPESQSLLITESTPNIRNLLQIVRQIDRPPEPVVSEFIQLKRADAKTVLEKLQKLFESNQPSENAPGGTARGIRPASVNITPEGTPIPPEATVTETSPSSLEISGGLSEDGIIVGKIKMAADERTNRIHVVTRPRNMLFIRQLLQEFDQDVPFGEPVTRMLRFRTASELLPVIVKAIIDPGAKVEDTGLTSGGTTGVSNRATSSLGSSRSTNDQYGGTDLSGSNAMNSNLSGNLEGSQRNTEPKAVSIGNNSKLIADDATNSIIVLGSTEIRSKVFRIIDEMDIRQPQVMLQTVIGELTLGANETFSVDYILRNSAARVILPVNTGTGTGTNTSTGSAAVATTPNGIVSLSGNSPVLNFNNLINQRTVTKVGVAGATGLSGFFTAGNTLDVIVNALESTNRFQVTARPMVSTTNNRAATLTSGQEIAVPTNIQSSFNTGTNLVTNSSVQFKSVALNLNILPLINSEKEVSLDIEQVADEISGSTRIDNNDIPTISHRVLRTHVTVPNHGTLVLGGLIRQSETNNRSGIPYLSRIPVLGSLFRSTTKGKTRTELVILIRPEVTMNSAEATEQRERQFEMLDLEPDLESSLAPPNVRKKAPASELMRRSPMILRQDEQVEVSRVPSRNK